MQKRISVRSLIEFILRSGDIDNRIGAMRDEAMAEGQRLHKQIQKRSGSDYRSEVPLSYTYSEDDIDLTVEGRADGIIENESGITVDEIKCTYGDIMHYKEARPMHLAQAKFYAYILLSEKNIPSIKVRLTYVNIETEEIRYFNYTFLEEELLKFTSDVCHEYIKWAKFSLEWIEKRNSTIKGLPFPFPYREGQDTLVKQVYHSILKEKKLFLEAPTGVGKTIATMYPAIQAMGAGLSQKIFYLTAKTITRTVSQNTVEILREKGLKIKEIVLTAKEKICFKESTECNPVSCPYAKGHFDRVNECIFAMLTECDDYNKETILKYAEKYKVCPFEMSLDLSMFSDIIIGDYNYAFDPRAKLKRYFEAETDDEYIFLIDEAHNLIDRAREMYSASLIKEDFLKIKNLTKDALPKISKQCENCNKKLLSLMRECDDYTLNPPIAPFTESLMRLYSAIEKFLQDERSILNKDKDKVPKEIKDEVLNFYFEIGHFLEIYELVNDDYTVYASFNEYGDFFVKLYCVNPRDNLMECMQKARSAILFSATLLPITYHKNLLGGEKEDYEVYAKSPFDPEKRGLFIARDVTSKYTRRNDTEYKKIARYINKIVSEHSGNYMAFFPSYAFMSEVFNAFEDLGFTEGKEILIQESNMSEDEKQFFLERFTGSNEEVSFDEINFNVEIEDSAPLLGFCVIGGIFSEGIDLTRDSLIGAIIVGTGFPLVCLEREIMKDKFDEDGQGFDYAYRYPGLNKVLQAAGRVIRTVSDIGVVYLLDERFLQSNYKSLFPREWSNYIPVTLSTVEKETKAFWNSRLS
ncbi:MAG: ATP-dependent DNA helicase [Lachnospiraceae bacterium]|nr:ATP-dependent DNA helicase [Lachnospiraceae bacterium]